jgi:uncharacterized protein (DUF849 family)
MLHDGSRLHACLNGSRSADEHPAVPITPDELAVAARAAVDAGADAIHMHPRDVTGSESLDADDIGAAVRSVRAACPGVPVGVSTGLWITANDPARRRASIARWSELDASERPDFASVNLNEPGFAAVADTLHLGGVDVEPGIWSVDDAYRLADIRPRRPWLRILVEVLDAAPDDALRVADDILDRLDRLDIAGDRLLHGQDEIGWPLIAHAGKLNLSTRIGLEDVLVTEDGHRVAGNAELIRLAAARLG